MPSSDEKHQKTPAPLGMGVFFDALVHIFKQSGGIDMLSRRTLLLKPMHTAVSGYARLQTENGRTLVQLHARGLSEGQVRLFAISSEHAARELGQAQVNAHGEASIEAEAPMHTQALILLGMPPKPLLIGLCEKQDAGTVLDVKNTALALAQKLQPMKRETEPPPAPKPSPKPAPTPSLPREIFLPAIDPAPYMQAASAPEEDPQSILPPPRPSGPPADRLKKLIWPRGFETLNQYFETGMPRRLFPLPGWRFVRAAQGLWLGMQAQDGKVQRIAYACEGDPPANAQEQYRSMQGVDGQRYQVLWMKV